MDERRNGKRTLSLIVAVLPMAWMIACTDATPTSHEDVAKEPLSAAGTGDGTDTPSSNNNSNSSNSSSAVDANNLGGVSGDRISQGRNTFRFETFGDQAFWGGQLRLHDAIKGATAGGVGAGISPKTALSLGLKVDVQALSRDQQNGIRQGTINLDDPAVTVALLKANAVIGLTGVFDNSGNLTSLGIQCALCHSIVDDSLAPGIGRRLDGWPNRDLDIGTIVAAAPDLSAFTTPLMIDDATLRNVLQHWGRGKFDALVNLDGKATRPDGGSAAVLIPPLFGLQGVGLMTWNGWGGIGVWVPLVINLEMHGQGVFSDRRLSDATQFPIAAAQGYARITNSPDLATPKFVPLIAYVESLEPPAPPRGSYDVNASKRGQTLFTGKARCSGCHVPPLYTTPGWNLVPASTIGIDSFQADRSPNHGYRPPPLRGVQTRMKGGGFFHDGRFATLNDVVNHFNDQFGLALADSEKSDLVEFLKTL